MSDKSVRPTNEALSPDEYIRRCRTRVSDLPMKRYRRMNTSADVGQECPTYRWSNEPSDHPTPADSGRGRLRAASADALAALAAAAHRFRDRARDRRGRGRMGHLAPHRDAVG